MITFHNITKKYGKECALENISLKIGNGVYGLIGENGAGKSTFLKLLTKELKADIGKIEIEQLNDIGYLPQNFSFYERLTLQETFNYLFLIRNSSYQENGKSFNKIIEYLSLQNYLDIKIGKLSGGVIQRIGIAQAFIGNPQIILLDEPTIGLDPKERINFRNMINEICEDKTIIIATHILEDVESSCDNMIYLKKGKLEFNGKISDFILKNNYLIYSANTTDLKKIGTFCNIISFKREDIGYFVRFAIKDEIGLACLLHLDIINLKKENITLEDAYVLSL